MLRYWFRPRPGPSASPRGWGGSRARYNPLLLCHPRKEYDEPLRPRCMAPFSSGELTIMSPGDWYQVRSDVPIVAEASGDPGRGQHVWFVAVNPKRKWYPLNEATKASSGRWTAGVSPGQISGNVKLCVVVADSTAVQVFEGFFQEAERDRRLYKAGLANPPEDADIKSCVDVLGP